MIILSNLKLLIGDII